MTKFLVTCTKIYNGTMFVDVENNEEALEIAQRKLNENVDCINWDFGEATADIADEDEEDNHTTPQPKYKVGDNLVHNDNPNANFTIVDIRNGKYECSDGVIQPFDELDDNDEFHLVNNQSLPKYKVGDYVVSECGAIYKVTNVENDKYDAEGKIGDEETGITFTAITFFVDDKKYRLATDEEIKKYNNQPHPKYKVGDIVKSDNSPADKIVSVNSETYFFESGEQSDITALDDDAHFYLVETIHREDFQPFDKVLVRDDNRCVWVCAFFSHIDYSSEVKPYVTCGGEVWEQCVPYNNETALYLGTKQDYNGKYKTW